MYTSDGRDIEMSVASTKAFYSQVVAGYLLGLNIASLVGTISNKEVRRELQELLSLPNKIASVLQNRHNIEVLARQYATTRRDWAVVGSGSTKAAADEIRIKLSELCYKSIATDYIEDKKHIDLSSEPLTLVCTAGLPAMALRDSVKEVAIFRSHKSIPIVIATEGFDEFEHYAAGVIYVPCASANASVLLNTVVGHLWGYYCALSINDGANLLKPGKKFEDCKIVFTGDGTQVCASLGFICSKLGAHFVHYGPKTAQLNEDHKKILEENCKVSGGTWEVTDNRDAVKGADFIYTDVWYGLYENEMPKEERVRVFHDYQVNRELMQLGNLGCKFLHCLPATRGEDVTDEVADSAASLCWEQAGNRLTAMRGLLVYFTRCRRSPSELALAAAREELDTFLAARLGGC